MIAKDEALGRWFGLGHLGSSDRVLGRLRWIFSRWRMGAPMHFRTSSDVLNHYVATLPTQQNAIDSVPGWTGAMPPETGLHAGTSHLYADNRIAWLLQSCFQVAGKTVLELGPLEGFHTYMLDRAGAASVEAIEANTLAYVRCLITKEVLKLARASFFLGDFAKWLENTEKRYDLLVASGVLYHSHDPVRLLELICEKSSAVYLWTHYFDDSAMPRDDRRRVPFSEAVETRISHGVAVRLYERSYYKAWRDPSFCGGMQDRHFWIDRADILNLLAAMGFGRVVIAHEEPDHVNGPSFSIFAERVDVAAIAEPAEAYPAPVGQEGTGAVSDLARSG